MFHKAIRFYTLHYIHHSYIFLYDIPLQLNQLQHAARQRSCPCPKHSNAKAAAAPSLLALSFSISAWRIVGTSADSLRHTPWIPQGSKTMMLKHGQTRLTLTKKNACQLVQFNYGWRYKIFTRINGLSNILQILYSMHAIKWNSMVICPRCWFAVRIVGVNWESKPPTCKKTYGQTRGGSKSSYWTLVTKPTWKYKATTGYQPKLLLVPQSVYIWFMVETPSHSETTLSSSIREDHHARHDGTILKSGFFATILLLVHWSTCGSRCWKLLLYLALRMHMNAWFHHHDSLVLCSAVWLSNVSLKLKIEYHRIGSISSLEEYILSDALWLRDSGPHLPVRSLCSPPHLRRSRIPGCSKLRI